MFQELMPLLEKRVLILTLSRVGAEEICVNVIPKPVKMDEREENNAIRTPLSLTGTPQELDRELPRELAEFVDSHLQLSSTLQTAKMEMDAAAKAAQDAAKKSSTKSRSYSKPPSNPDTNSLLNPEIPKRAHPLHPQPAVCLRRLRLRRGELDNALLNRGATPSTANLPQY